MKCLVLILITLGLVMSVPLHYRDSAQEEDAIKDYPDAASVPQERDPALKFPLALLRAKNSQERDSVERENQMTGERRGYGYGYGGYRGGYGGYAGNSGSSGKAGNSGSAGNAGYGYGGYRGGYGGYAGNSGSSGKAGNSGNSRNSGSAGNAGYGYGGYRGGYGRYGYGKRS